MNSDTHALVEELRQLRLRVEQLESQRRRRVRSTFVFVAVALVSVTAWGQLVVFAPDEPARADQVNANFVQLRTWLEQKVGPVGTSTITLATPLAGTMVQDGTLTSADLTDNSVASIDIADGTISNADLDPDLSCPNTARTTFGQCLFFKTGSFNYRGAAAACVSDRARLCTVAELSAGLAAGYQNCANGWLADRINSASAYVGYPYLTTVPGACNEGLNLQTPSTGALFGAYCCK